MPEYTRVEITIEIHKLKICKFRQYNSSCISNKGYAKHYLMHADAHKLYSTSGLNFVQIYMYCVSGPHRDRVGPT